MSYARVKSQTLSEVSTSLGVLQAKRDLLISLAVGYKEAGSPIVWLSSDGPAIRSGSVPASWLHAYEASHGIVQLQKSIRKIENENGIPKGSETHLVAEASRLKALIKQINKSLEDIAAC